MSVKTKKRLHNFAKTVGVFIFSLVFFLNIKIMLSDSASNQSSDLSLFGLKVNLFNATNATETPKFQLAHAKTCIYEKYGMKFTGSKVDCESGGTYCTIMPCN